MPRITIPNDFEPRAYQKGLMGALDSGKRRAVAVWHRRAGKDLCLLHQEAKCALDGKPAVYWHFFPTFEQGRKAIWEHVDHRRGQRLMDWVFPGFSSPGSRSGGVVRRVDQSKMLVEFKNGSIWRLMGSDRTENVGAGPYGVGFSEYALCKPTAWDFVRPMLRENGGWAAFITTPRGANHAWDLYKMATTSRGWWHDLKTVHDTGLTYASTRDPDGPRIGPQEMIEEELAEGMLPELARQEYECDWSAANVGAIWGKLIEGLEREHGRWGEPWVADYDGIFTAWDLGHSDATAIWFFRHGRSGYEFVDYYEGQSLPFSHYLDILEEKASRHGYRYVRHFIPHDARARTLATGVSVLDLFLKWCGSFDSESKMGKVSIVPQLSLVDGLQAARWLLQQPGLRFHKACSTHHGLQALKEYRSDYNEDRKVFSTTPLHDWTSHAADAFRYAALSVKLSEGMRPREEGRGTLVQVPGARVEQVPLGPLAAPISGSMSLEQLWQARRDQLGRRR